MGWRKSWLSREIMAFGIQMPAVLLAVGSIVSGISLPDSAFPAVLWTSLLAGIAGVFSSGMVYHVTHRPSWRGPRSLLRFSLTVLSAFASSLWIGSYSVFAVAGLAVVSAAKMGCEIHWQRLALEGPEGPLAASARILDSTLGLAWRLRVTALLLGGIVLPLVSLTASVVPIPVLSASAILLLAGEVLERLLFFRAAQPWHMPGWVTSAKS